MSADVPIAEKRSQTTAHLKEECFLKFIKKEHGQSETHGKQTQPYKKRNFRMYTRWHKIFYIYHTCSVFVDLPSKQMLAWYKQTYKGTPFLFSAAQFPSLRRNKASKFSTCKHLLFNCIENPCASSYIQDSYLCCHIPHGQLPSECNESWNTKQSLDICSFTIPCQYSQSPSGKFPMTNVTTQSDFLNILSSSRVSLPLESSRLELLN